MAFQDVDPTDAGPWVWAFLSAAMVYLVSFAAFVGFARFEPEPFNDEDDDVLPILHHHQLEMTKSRHDV